MAEGHSVLGNLHRLRDPLKTIATPNEPGNLGWDLLFLCIINNTYMIPSSTITSTNPLNNISLNFECTVKLDDAVKSKPLVKFIKCGSRQCKLCDHFLQSNIIHGSGIDRKYESVVPKNIYVVDCSTVNCVYMITCNKCSMQYTGETTQRLKDRFGMHRAGMKNPDKENTCRILYNHFNNNMCKGCGYSVQILEVLPGSGRNPDKSVCQKSTKIRREKETEWMLKLRTVHPYGLNDRIGSDYRSALCSSIVSFFPPLHREKSREQRSRSRPVPYPNPDLLPKIRSFLHDDVKSAMNNIRMLLFSLKKSILKKLADDINEFLSRQKEHFPFMSWYLAAIDIIEGKIYKIPAPKPKKKVSSNRINILFINKGLDLINLGKLLTDKEIFSSFPNFKKQDKPIVVYSLTKCVRSKLFNYKEFVNLLDPDAYLKDNNIYPCECEQSPFKDEHHGHIVSGNLQLVSNNNLRKLISKGPKYREPAGINWDRCRKNIVDGLKDFVEKTSSKLRLNKATFSEWYSKLMGSVDKKIKTLKTRIKESRCTSIFENKEVENCLNQLQNLYVLVPIDKASNNVAFVCKRFYADKLFHEMGLDKTTSKTYSRCKMKPDTCIKKLHKSMSSEFNIKVTNDHEILPVAYWMPKMHKSPIGARFIVASKFCVSKELSKNVASIFKLFFDQIKHYHDKVRYFSGIKTFWVTQNNQSALKSIAKINIRKAAKSVSTFDFSTLYTNIPHSLLLEVLDEIIEFCFRGCTKDSIEVNKFGGAHWTTSISKKTNIFTKTFLTKAVHFLVNNCYFTIGKILLKQVIGLPMGGDPAPFWANLFLFHFEYDWLKRMRKENNILARKFTNTFRFIDDLLSINDGGEFEKHHHEIYPKELQLKKENVVNTSCTFLDLDITIEDKILTTKLYDKRDTYTFSIVRLPYRKSNIPNKMFLSCIGAELLRMTRATSDINSLLPTFKALNSRMIKQGASLNKINSTCERTMSKHWEDFEKYGTNKKHLLIQLFS